MFRTSLKKREKMARKMKLFSQNIYFLRNITCLNVIKQKLMCITFLRKYNVRKRSNAEDTE